MSKKDSVARLQKILRVIFVISLVCLIAAVIGYTVSGNQKVELADDPVAAYQAALAEFILYWVMIAFAVVTAVSGCIGHWANVKETHRKSMVSLKRNPSIIPLLMLAAAFLLYSLNLTHVSDTTAKIQGKGMGLCQFCIMLLSMLSMVCLLNAYPRRKKPNIPMIVLTFVMFGVMIFCDIHYRNAILAALYRPENPIVINEATMYIANAYNMLGTYVWLIAVTAVLVATVPLYGKLLKKINTSVAVEGNDEMAAIEISD